LTKTIILILLLKFVKSPTSVRSWPDNLFIMRIIITSQAGFVGLC